MFAQQKNIVSDHLHVLHYHLILTRGIGAALAAVERVCGSLYLSDKKKSTFGEGSHGGEETAVPSVGGDHKQHSMGQISRLLEDRTLSDHGSVWMNGALQHTTKITLDQPDEASARIFARHMYSLLIHRCEGRALAIVRGAPDHNGLEAWRLLHEWYQPKTRSRCLALLNEILGWDFGTKEQFLHRMKDWEECDARVQQNCKCAPLHEEVLVAVLISRSPKEVRTYLHVQMR